MYMVWVYDGQKHLVGKFTKPSYQEAMRYLISEFGAAPYEIRKVS